MDNNLSSHSIDQSSFQPQINQLSKSKTEIFTRLALGFLILLFTLVAIGAGNFILFNNIERALARILTTSYFILEAGLISTPFFLLGYFQKKSTKLFKVLISLLNFPIAGFSFFVSGKVVNLIFKPLGLILAPHYIIGYVLYDKWSSISLFLSLLIIPLGIYLIIRQISIIQEVQSKLKKYTRGRLLMFLIFIIVIILIFFYFINSTLRILDIRSEHISTTGQDKNITKDNIYVNPADNYEITLYPRNGTWTNKGGRLVDLLEVPDSENKFSLSVKILPYKVTNGRQEIYSEDLLRYEVLNLNDLAQIDSFSSNKISWALYRKEVLNIPTMPAYTAHGVYGDNLIELYFSYRTDYPSNIVINQQGKIFFTRMVKSFQFIKD